MKVICENVEIFSAGYYHLGVITKDGKVLTTGETGQSKLGRTGSGFGFLECSLPVEIEKPFSVSCGGSVSYIICQLTNQARVLNFDF